jgi:hypothetical protein
MDTLRTIIAWLVVIATVLLPLKFGSITGLPETTAYYPDSLFAWIVICWPAVSFPLIAGVLALISLAVFPVRWNFSRSLNITVVFWLLLACASLLGSIDASTYDFVLMQVVHIFGVATFGITIYLVIINRPDFKIYIIAGLFVGTILTAWFGVEQMIFGFEETRKFLEMQEAQYGVNFSGDFKARVWDNRVFSTFAACNSLAGYMLLTMPVCFFFCWKICGNIEPIKVSRIIFISILAALLGVVFFATVSRAAYLSLVLAMVLFIMLFPVPRGIKIVFFISLPIIIITGALVIMYAGRGFHSMMVRVDYIYSSFLMFLEHPFWGTGWGDFFHDYMRVKFTASKEAPHSSHNILMDFLSQTGFFGFIACIAAVFYPLIQIRRKIRLNPALLYSSVESYLFLGISAFFIHSLMDVHLQIPGSMAAALAMMLVAICPNDEPISSYKKKSKNINVIVTIIIIITGIISISGGYQLLLADYSFASFAEICSTKGKTKMDFAKIQPEQIKIELENCLRYRPYSPFPWATAGDYMLNSGYPSLAEEYYLEALKRSPMRSFLYHRLYLLQSVQGRDDDAKLNLEQAKKLFPNNLDYNQQKNNNRE